MALTRKKLQNILKQTRWSGHDVGKIYLLNFINELHGKPALADDEIFTVEQAIKNSPTQIKIAQAYEAITKSIGNLYNIATGNFQRGISAYREILRKLNEIRTAENSIQIAIHTPYCCTTADFEKLQAETQKHIDGKNYGALNLIVDIAQKWINAREKAPVEAKAIFDALEKEKAENSKVIEKYSFMFNDTREYITYGTLKGKKNDVLIGYSDEYNKHFYELTEIACREWIKNELPKEDYRFFNDIAKSTYKIISNDVEVIETFYRYYLFFNDRIKDPECDYEMIESKVIGTETIQKNTPNKFELLEVDLEFESASSYYKENPAEFAEDYKALFELAKNELAKTSPAIKDALEQCKNIKNLSFTGKQLNRNADLESVTEYFSKKEPLNFAEYIRQQRIYNCGIAITVTSKNIYDETFDNSLLELIETNLQKLSDLTPDYTEAMYKSFEEAIEIVNAYNTIIELYSDLLRVDLTPLEIKDTLNSCATNLNVETYLAYSYIKGDKETIEARRGKIKDCFKVLDYTKYETPAPKKEAIFNELSTLSKSDTFSFLNELASLRILNRLKTPLNIK